MSTAITELTQLRTPSDLRHWSRAIRRAGCTLGLVPTMGALHRGHRSLIERAVSECDSVCVSIFVNPAQFGPHEDFSRYPRTLGADLDLCRSAGVAAVFTPGAEAMYAPDASVGVTVGDRLTSRFEGAARPGHFDGVALVVLKLLIAADPDRAYFGQKDAQQVAVVRRLIRDLDLGCELVVCPVVRDDDGLALSSRNAYLGPSDREAARFIPRALAAVAARFDAGVREAATLIATAQEILDRAPGLELDYVAAVDPDTFRSVEITGVKTQIVVAAKLAGIRLIDVLRLGVDTAPVSGGAQTTREGGAPDVAGA